MSLSIYIYINLSFYLHRQAGKTFGARGRREKHPLDRGNGASIVETRGVVLGMRLLRAPAVCSVHLYMRARLHSSAQCPLSK